MKFLSLFLFIVLGLHASNMALDEYNDPDFKTHKELRLAKEKREKAAQLQNEIQLKKFHLRQAELKKQRHKDSLGRKENRQLKKEFQDQQKQEEQKQEEQRVHDQIQQNLLQAQEEEHKKQDFVHEQEEAYLLAQKHQRQEALQEDSNLSLTPEQANLSIENPDDIQTELQNVNRLRYILLASPNTPEYVKDYIRLMESLQGDYNLDIAFSYRGVVQGELNKGKLGAGGKYDATVLYTPQENTLFALRLEGRHQVGAYSSAEFRDEVGMLTSSSASYRKEDPFISQAWVQQSFDKFSFRAGKIDPSSYIDSHQFKSSSRFFFNSTFSSSPYNSYPSLGLGIAGKYNAGGYYIATEVNDANAYIDQMDASFFTKNEYYTALEFGITPKDGSKYHLTAWHRDASRRSSEQKGVIASVVQTINEDMHFILRGALSDKATAKRYASLGLGMYSKFIEHDISGLAIGMLEPSNATQRTQTALEYFYRVDPLPGVQLSADMQIVYHPSASQETWAILPGLRLRVIF